MEEAKAGSEAALNRKINSFFSSENAMKKHLRDFLTIKIKIMTSKLWEMWKCAPFKLNVQQSTFKNAFNARTITNYCI